MIARGDGVGGAGSTSLPQYLDYSSTGDPYQQPSGGSLQSGNIMFDNYMVNNTGTTPHNQGFIPVLPDSYNASNLGTSYSVQASQHRADPMGQYYDRSTSNDYLYSTGRFCMCLWGGHLVVFSVNHDVVICQVCRPLPNLNANILLLFLDCPLL